MQAIGQKPTKTRKIRIETTVLGRMSPGKMASGKMPPGKFPPRKLPTGKLPPRKTHEAFFVNFFLSLTFIFMEMIFVCK